jgi:peptidoglycan DL-endopeptidase CwlO
MLAERPQVSAGDSRASGAGSAGSASAGTGADPGSSGDGPSGTGPSGTGPSGTGSFGARSARKKRGLFRRHGSMVAAGTLALLLVVVVWGAAKVMNPQGTGASSLFQSIDGLAQSGSVALLEQERQKLIEMTAASKTLTVASKPAMADPEQILESQDSSTASSNETTGGTGVATTAPPADPTAAEATAKAMLASFGFGSSQWSCLYDLWQRESGWNVYAENAASGAYGIPQSLPGDKMATSGSDWQTNAATQINWGLGYIKSVYGTPCGAWSNEVNYGYY